LNHPWNKKNQTKCAHYNKTGNWMKPTHSPPKQSQLHGFFFYFTIYYISHLLAVSPSNCNKVYICIISAQHRNSGSFQTFNRADGNGVLESIDAKRDSKRMGGSFGTDRERASDKIAAKLAIFSTFTSCWIHSRKAARRASGLITEIRMRNVYFSKNEVLL
jgi:hypothetical protein